MRYCSEAQKAQTKCGRRVVGQYMEVFCADQESNIRSGEVQSR